MFHSHTRKLLVALATAVTLAVAGCGGDDESSSSGRFRRRW